MPEGLIGAMTVYNDEFFGVFNEVLAENTDLFNSASGGAIRLFNEFSLGDFQHEAFWPDIATLVNRRDLTSTSAGTADNLTNDEMRGPKLSRRWQIDNTDDSFERLGASVSEFVSVVGEKVAKQLAADYVDTAIRGLVICTLDVTSGGPSGNGTYINRAAGTPGNDIRVTDMISGKATMGDAHQDVGLWVMHSKPFFDLVGDQASNYQIDRVAGTAIVTGLPVTLGVPVLVTDNDELINTDGVSTNVDSYYTLGLMPSSATIQISNTRNEVDRVTGNEQLFYRVQGESDYVLRVKGFDYTDTTRNPTNATVATAGNWATIVDSVKNGPGFVIESA